MKRDPAALQLLLDKAQFMHKKGYNCAETAAWALASYWNLDVNISAATGFGGGIARTGATCGALTGAIMVLDYKVGRVDPEDDEKKQLCYKLGQQAIAKFLEQMGTSACRDIIGFVLGEPGGADKYAAGGFKDGKCKNAVEVAIRAAIEADDNVEGATR